MTEELLTGTCTIGPGHVAQSVTCLTTDVSDYRSRRHEFDPSPVPYFSRDHELISTVILPSAVSFKKGCCQLQVKVCELVQACPGKKCG